MTKRGQQDYYDPIIEEPKEFQQIKIAGMAVAKPGNYVSLEDIIDAIEAYGFAAEDRFSQKVIYELASWLESSILPQEEESDVFTQEELEEVLRKPRKRSKDYEKENIVEVYERIELYPTADGKFWGTRLIDKNGRIAKNIREGINKTAEEKFASELYPELIIFEVQSEDEDSTWDRKGLSPRLWDSRR